MIGFLRAVSGAIILNVHVMPRAHRNEVVGVSGDAVRVRLTAPPVEGKANKVLVDFLAEELGIPRSSIEIVGGLSSRNKKVRLRGVTRTQIEKMVKKDLA